MDWKKGGVLVASDEIVRSPGGRVIGELIDGSGWTTNNATVAYDAAGRLVSSFPAAGVSYTYGYGSSLPGCWAGSGRNSDRTTRTGSGGPIVYCYNDRDQLVSYSVNGATSQQASYDQFGQTSSLASKSFGWSPRGTHISTTTSATTITFERDGLERIIRRSQTDNQTYGTATIPAPTRPHTPQQQPHPTVEPSTSPTKYRPCQAE